MPLSSGLSIHDDTKHKGSAKRDAVNGVAGLDASGNVEDEAGNDCETINNKGAVSGYAGLDASALLPEVLIPGVLNKYIISDNLHTAQDSELSTTSEIYVNKDYMGLNILYPTPSTVRISFDIKSNTGAALAYGRLYKDDVPIGVERSTLSTSYVTFSEDISFAEWEYIQLWMRTENGAQPAYARNFRLYGDEHAQTLAEAIVQGDVGVSDCLDVV